MADESDVSLLTRGVALSERIPSAPPAVNGERLANRERTYSVSDEAGLNEILEFKDTRRFVERQYRSDALEYQRPGKESGLVLIFAQENFMYHKKRNGTRRDVNEIVTCLQRKGYNIDRNDIMLDGTSQEIMDKLNEVSERDLTEYNSLMVFFLTHGDVMDQLYTKDGCLWANDLWKIFEDSLKNKPKMFVLQACKGGSFSTIGESPRKKSAPIILPSKAFETNYLPKDFLIVYSTLEGNVAFRNTASGSWFIQELCKNFASYGQIEDVFSLLIRTSKCVSGNYYYLHENQLKKQMPVIVSTLTKKFYLNTNRLRDHQMEMIERIKSMHENLTNLDQKLNIKV